MSGVKQRADFKESLAAQDLAFHGQSSALVVGQENSLLSELLFQYSILSSQVIDRFLLLSIDPTGEDGEKQLPWREDEVHIVRREVEGWKSPTLGRSATVVN